MPPVPGLQRAPEPVRAWLNPHLLPVGCAGAPAGEGAAADRAIAEAEAWLAGRGCTRVRGPLDGATWFTYRANLGPHDQPPFPGEPRAAPEPWLRRGYRVVARYTSTLVDSAAQVAAAEPRARRLRAAGWRVEDLADQPGFDATLAVFHRIASRAFAGAFSFSPLPLADFAALYAPWRDRLEPGLVLLARDPEGRPAGFAFAFPDLLAPRTRRFVLKTLAVDPAHGGHGLGTWLAGEVHRRALALGLDGGGVHALMAESAHSRSLGGLQGRLIRRYALYEKALPQRLADEATP